MRKILSILLIVVIGIFLIHPKEAAARNAQWTVMVYLNGDNNLEGYGIDDFNEMEMVGSSPDVNIIVQFDRAFGYDYSNGDWKTCRRYYVTKDEEPDSITSDLIEDIGEVDMGDPNTLSAFGNWVKSNYPAFHYLLVIWNHGEGWRKIGEPIEPIKSVSYDESSGNDISVANGELAQALSSIGNIDILGFDACLMQMWEVMVNVSPYAAFMVGSEETESADGWNYTGFLRDLVMNPIMEPLNLGKSIVNNSHQTTLSVVALAEIDSLIFKVDTFALELMRARDEGYGDTIKVARSQTHNFYEWSYIDLYDFAKHIQLSNVPELLKATSSLVMDGINNAVKETNNTCPSAYGISVSHPSSPTYYNSLYSKLEVAELTRWDEYLRGCMYNDTAGIYGGIGNNWTGIDTIIYDGSPYSFWGYNEDSSFYAAVRFTPSKPCTLKAAIAFLNHEFDYTLYIYKAGNYSMPDSILHTQTGTSHHCWNYIPLTSPVAIESADDFWICIYTQKAYYPIGVDNGAWGSHRSYCSFDGKHWEEVYQNPTFYNFNIRAEVGYYLGIPVKETKDRKFDKTKDIINMQIHPNPFSTKTVIEFESSGVKKFNSQVTNSQTSQLKIYDVSGRLVRSFPLLSSPSSLFSSVTWDGKDEKGRNVKSGIYFLKLKVKSEMLNPIRKRFSNGVNVEEVKKVIKIE